MSRVRAGSRYGTRSPRRPDLPGAARRYRGCCGPPAMTDRAGWPRGARRRLAWDAPCGSMRIPDYCNLSPARCGYRRSARRPTGPPAGESPAASALATTASLRLAHGHPCSVLTGARIRVVRIGWAWRPAVSGPPRRESGVGTPATSPSPAAIRRYTRSFPEPVSPEQPADCRPVTAGSENSMTQVGDDITTTVRACQGFLACHRVNLCYEDALLANDFHYLFIVGMLPWAFSLSTPRLGGERPGDLDESLRAHSGRGGHRGPHPGVRRDVRPAPQAPRDRGVGRGGTTP